MKRTNQIPLLGLIFLTCLSAGSTTHAALFNNGSFESSFASWTAAGSVGISSQATDGFLGATYSAGDTPNNGILSQTFDTIALQTYTVLFDYGRLTTGGSAEQRLQIEIRDGTNPGDQLINIGSGTVNTTHGATILQNSNILQVRDPNGSSFIPYSSAPNAMFSAWSFTFTAESASSTIVLSDISTGTLNEDGNLDNIRISNIAVPEPCTWAFGFVCSGVALSFRNRRRKVA